MRPRAHGVRAKKRVARMRATTVGSMPATARRLALLVLTAVCLLAGASQALGATITLTRTPGPPQAVLNDGSSFVSFTYTIEFDSAPDHYDVAIVDPDGAVVSTQAFGITGVSSPYSSSGTFTVPAAAKTGTWRVRVNYFADDPDFDYLFEQGAEVTFNVANAVGTLRVVKFEDRNGNGVRDTGEPGVPGWPVDVEGPSGSLSVTKSLVTGADGSVTIPNVMIGDYRVTEGSGPLVPVAGESWQNTDGATSKTIVVGNGQTATASFANARLGQICGIVYRDDNRNGVRDPQETGRVAGATVRLSGPASASRITGPDGAYCFTGLLPGDYRVSDQPPAPLEPTGDVDGPANGNSLIAVALASGGVITGRDFGLAPPAATLAITKRASAKVRRGGDRLTWTITVRNTSKTQTAKAVIVRDPLPLRATVVSLGGGRLRAGLVVWNLGDLKPGAKKTVRFVVRIDRGLSGGTLVNTARAEATNAKMVAASARCRIIPLPPPPRRIAVTG